jgi:hypothetical protein
VILLYGHQERQSNLEIACYDDGKSGACLISLHHEGRFVVIGSNAAMALKLEIRPAFGKMKYR